MWDYPVIVFHGDGFNAETAPTLWRQMISNVNIYLWSLQTIQHVKGLTCRWLWDVPWLHAICYEHSQRNIWDHENTANLGLSSRGRLLVQYIPRNVHMVRAVYGFVVAVNQSILTTSFRWLHWHLDNHSVAAMSAKQPVRVWINRPNWKYTL